MNLLSNREVRGPCIRKSRSIASRGLITCPLSLQTHVNEEVNTLHLDPLQSIKDISPRIRFGLRDLLVASQHGGWPSGSNADRETLRRSWQN